MGYVVQLEVYQGPFDLLLDLIAKNEVDIWDIPIAAITEQYLAYLYSLQEKDLAIAGEFLVMAATLIRLKSRLLLPQEPVEEDSEEPEDPRKELVEQLLRYKFFKEAAQFLQARYTDAVRYYTKGQRLERYNLTPIYTQPVGDLTLEDLARFYENLRREQDNGEPRVHEIYARIPLQARIALVRLRLVGSPRLSFRSLLQDCTPGEIVGTFLAVLELVRLGEIRVVQDTLFGEISIQPYLWEVEVNP